MLFSMICFSKKNTIYVYNDVGVSEKCASDTCYMLKKCVRADYHIQKISADKVISGEWMFDAVLFIIPGGKATPYAERLNGQGNDNIKSFVRNGGSYLGICAGGYYGSSHVEFDKGGPLEVCGDMELCFIKCKAIGPVLCKYDYNSLSGALAANIITNEHENVVVWFNGGAYFDCPKSMDDVVVLAAYDHEGHNEPAIIYAKYETGNVVLSGVHFEHVSNCSCGEPLCIDCKLIKNRSKIDVLSIKILRLLNIRC